MPKQNRQPGIHLHKTQVRVASIKSNMTTKDLYVDQWYWILIARNGKTIARSFKTYKRKRIAVYSIEIAACIISGQIPKSYFDHTGKNGIEVVEF